MIRGIWFAILFIIVGLVCAAVTLPLFLPRANPERLGELVFPFIVIICGTSGFVYGWWNRRKVNTDTQQRLTLTFEHSNVEGVSKELQGSTQSISTFVIRQLMGAAIIAIASGLLCVAYIKIIKNVWLPVPPIVFPFICDLSIAALGVHVSLRNSRQLAAAVASPIMRIVPLLVGFGVVQLFLTIVEAGLWRGHFDGDFAGYFFPMLVPHMIIWGYQSVVTARHCESMSGVPHHASTELLIGTADAVVMLGFVIAFTFILTR